MNRAFDAAAGASRAALEGGEEVAVEAAAVREVLVRLRAVMRQHGVGEVVVLVDDHVQRYVVVASVPEQLGQPGGDRGRRENVPHRRLGKQVGMAPQRSPQRCQAVGLELPLQGLQLVVDVREVEAQGDVAALFPGRRAPHVGAGEGGVEAVRPEAVVVVLQHRGPQRLAEAARADQEGVALVLQAPQEAGLVDVQPAVAADAPEVGLTVGNAGVGGRRAHDRSLSTDPIVSQPPAARTHGTVERRRAAPDRGLLRRPPAPRCSRNRGNAAAGRFSRGHSGCSTGPTTKA